VSSNYTAICEAVYNAIGAWITEARCTPGESESAGKGLGGKR